jgi:hypothetical protein
VQSITFNFSVLPAAWLLGEDHRVNHGIDGAERGAISCEVRDIWDVAGTPGQNLGSFVGSFEAKDLAPHGSRFLMLSNCSRAAEANASRTKTVA